MDITCGVSAGKRHGVPVACRLSPAAELPGRRPVVPAAPRRSPWLSSASSSQGLPLLLLGLAGLSVGMRTAGGQRRISGSHVFSTTVLHQSS